MSPSPNRRSRFDYDLVAPRYDHHRRSSGPYYDRLAQLAARTSARHVLELGCGTGNSTAAFVSRYPCTPITLDRSIGMLRHVRAKVPQARRVFADAQALPLGAGVVDFVYGVMLLHHLDGLNALAEECFRVLSRGCAAFVTASHEFIERHPMTAYFPSFATIDKARFQPVEAVVAALECAGFLEVAAVRVLADPEPIDEPCVRKVAAKFISTYSLVPEAEFRLGLERLKYDVGRLGALPEPMSWEAVVVSGGKV